MEQIDLHRVNDAITECCDRWAEYINGYPTIMVPRIGTHVVISGAVSLSDYKEYLQSTTHFNLCSSTLFPTFGPTDTITIAYSLAENDMLYFNTYIPSHEERVQPLVDYVTAASNNSELITVLDTDVDQVYLKGQFEQCFKVRELNLEWDATSYLFFTMPEAGHLTVSEFLPTKEYEGIWYDSAFGMSGCCIKKGDSNGQIHK